MVCLCYLVLPKDSYADVLFEDDFNDGDDIGWTKIGPLAESAWHVENGYYKARINSQGVVDTVVGEEEWGDYIIEFDMLPIAGEDKNIDQRWTSSTGFTYEIHFTNGGFDTTGGSSIHRPLINGQLYHMKLIMEGRKVDFYMNGEFMFSEINYYENVKGKVGLRVGTGGIPSEVWYDNFIVTTLDHTEEEPRLDVPLLKQTDPVWANDVYDSANLWTTGGKGMSNWGCAVTSAAMVFQYNSLTKMQDNSSLTPGSLNAWLKTQPDGYVRNGLLNWLALSRLSTQIAQMNGVSFDALEYTRINGRNDDAVRTQLISSNPQILAVPGHFVVAVGEDIGNSTFFINDPYYDRESLAEGYDGNYLAAGTFTPVNSDLSYIMLVVDSDIDIQLLDPVGDPVGDSFIEDPIIDQAEDAPNSAGSVKVFYLPKPSSGEYELDITATSTGPYVLDQYFYDANGNVKKITVNRSLVAGNTETYLINFDKETSSNSNSIRVIQVTFDTVKQQIIDGFNQKKIKNRLTYATLLFELELARRTKSKVLAKGILNAMILLIRTDKKIDPAYATDLINNIRILRDSI